MEYKNSDSEAIILFVFFLYNLYKITYFRYVDIKDYCISCYLSCFM